MKPYRFENTPLLKAYSKRPGSDNELDRRRANKRRNRIETDAVANETASGPYLYLLLTEVEVRTVSYGPSIFPFDLWPKREARRR